MKAHPLFARHEPAFRAQYAELKERAASAGALLPGTPGTLTRRSPNARGEKYWYRVYYALPGKQAEQFVAPASDTAAHNAMQQQIAFADWMQQQVVALRKLGFQIADKRVARVLVELHNRGAFGAGLTVVGTLAYMAWLNELGARAVAAATQDIDFATRLALKLAAPLHFRDALADTGLPFVDVPNLQKSVPSTSVKLRGAGTLRVDLLAPGKSLGQAVSVPSMQWHAQTVPFYDYLLADAEPAAMLAGGQCVPVRLPQATRMAWHKLYSSTQRVGTQSKAAKDRHQAATLVALLVDEQPGGLEQAWRAASPSMRKSIRALKKQLAQELDGYPQAQEVIAACLK